MDLVSHSYIAALFLQFSLLAGLFLARKQAAACLERDWGPALRLTALLWLAGLALRLWAVPHRPYVFYDEYEHLALAGRLAEGLSFVRCDFRLDGFCYSGWLPQWPPGHHALLAWVFKVAGAGWAQAFMFNAFVSSLAIPLFFFFSAVLFRGPRPGLASASLIAFLPLHLKFSGNASLEGASLTFILLALCSWLVYAGRGGRRAFFLAVSATAFSAFVRPENFLLFCFLAALPFLRSRRPSPACVLLFLPYLVLPALYLPAIREYNAENWLPSREQLDGLGLCFRNLRYWLNGPGLPPAFGLAALSGIFLSFRENKAPSAFLLPAAAFLLVYSFAQKLDLWALDLKRFNVPLLAFAVPPAGLAAAWLYDKAAARRGMGGKAAAAAALSVWLLSGAGFVGREIVDPAFVSQWRFLSGLRDVPGGAVFAAANPSMASPSSRGSAVHPEFLFSRGGPGRLLAGRDIVLVRDRWCDEGGAELCAALLAGPFSGPESIKGPHGLSLHLARNYAAPQGAPVSK